MGGLAIRQFNWQGERGLSEAECHSTLRGVGIEQVVSIGNPPVLGRMDLAIGEDSDGARCSAMSFRRRWT